MAGNNQQRKMTVSCEINSLRNNEEVKEHENVQDTTIFSCEYCNHTSKWKHHIKTHEKNQHGNEIILFPCELCPFTSKWKGDVKEHERIQHGNEINLFVCSHCNFTSKYKNSIKRHKKHNMKKLKMVKKK